jgi:hypothetical protein
LPFDIDNNGNHIIEDANDLLTLASMVSNGHTYANQHFILANYIVLPLNQPNNTVSIGNKETNKPFSGTFDGNNKTISNVYIDLPNNPYQGFFGYTKDAYIHNLGLVNITASGRNYTGGMVAYAENTYLNNSYVNGGTLYALSYVGGLVGYQTAGTNSIISGCYNTCKVQANRYVGGLLGYSYEGTVRNSYVATLVTGADTATTGAIIGGAIDVLSYNCFFNDSVTGQTSAIGEDRITKSGSGNRRKSGEGKTSIDMRTQAFVDILNNGLAIPVWRRDYESPINNGFPILIWQRSKNGCDSPSNLNVAGVSSTSVSLSWQGTTDDHFVVEYGKTGGSTQSQNVTTSFITLTGLEASTEYWWKVKTVCAVGESEFASGTNFTTSQGGTGITNVNGQDNLIAIYPNPAQDNLTISGLSGSENIILTDISGRTLYTAKANGATEIQLPVNHLAKGMYFVRVNNKTMKIIKN